MVRSRSPTTEGEKDMLRWFAKRLNDVQKEEAGFTLIELLVVILIIGILAAIAIPAFLAQRERAWEAAAQSDLRNAAAAATSCSIQQGGSFAGPCGVDTVQPGAADDLRDFGYRPTNLVAFDVTLNNATTWSARAEHCNGGNAYQFSTAANSRVEPMAARFAPTAGDCP